MSIVSPQASGCPRTRFASWPRTPDILPLGMLADALRRRLHGSRVTFLRVAACAFDQSIADAVPPAARELRLTGSPDTLDAAINAVQAAKSVAGVRTVAAFTWADAERWRAADGQGVLEETARRRPRRHCRTAARQDRAIRARRFVR